LGGRVGTHLRHLKVGNVDSSGYKYIAIRVDDLAILDVKLTGGRERHRKPAGTSVGLGI
jgi:hypothetical protein